MDRPCAAALEMDSRSPPARWSSGLCDCFSDTPGCCLACWCPCITFGRIAEITDKGATPCAFSGAIYVLLLLLFPGFARCYSCCYRSKLRKQYMLEGNLCTDCLVHWFCQPCALCQEYSELKHRGFDMAAGIYFTLIFLGQLHNWDIKIIN
ncbi:hypothetical protein DKX38_018131 [Salix brachista]|uniref:Uncharacterized protein n=1 Tax=Salix brachista TaxID=2182728 RepID=A0A5N5KWV8_9ROSI|nr:hypothetical protein DKX38_018013 [Salix brachista]KAB5535045.1 hypothetical protein DKX38_018131 [Salix brachista]